MTYNTGNPLGSTDPRDLYDNAENFDEAMNGLSNTYSDRFGNTRMTLHGAITPAVGEVDAAKVSAIASINEDVASVGGVVDWTNTYLGGKISSPATRNNGSALQNGDVYFNTSTNRMMAYASGTWYATETAGATSSPLVAHTPAAGVVTTVESKLLDLDSGNCLVNEFGLLAAHDGFRKLETELPNVPYYVGVTGYGDSMANPGGYMMGVFGRALQLRYGTGGLFTPGLGQTTLGAAWVFTGGASQPRNDWTYLPGANQVVIPSGGSAQYTTGGILQESAIKEDGAYPAEYVQNDQVDFTMNFKKVRYFYLTRPGDGTLTVSISQTGAAYTPSVVSCNAALGLSYVDIPVVDPCKSVILLASASGGTCLFIGAVFLRETGVLLWSSQVGGSTMEQQKAYITAGNDSLIYAPLCAALSTALIVHQQRVPGDANWQTNYPIVFNSLSTMTTVSQLVLGEPPRTDAEVPTVPTINAFLRTQCLARGLAFFDQYKALGNSNSVLTVLGWGNNDGVHLDPPAHRYLAGKILKAVDWFRIGGNKLDSDPLTMGRYLKHLPILQAIQNLRSSTIYGRALVTMDGTVTSGGYTFAPTNDKGFALVGAAALGYVAGRPGMIVSGNPAVSTASKSVYSAFIGYRNMSLPAGVRAFVLLGVTSTFYSLSALNQRCYGFECAKGSDVGSPSGITGEVIRLVSSNGASTSYGPWVLATIPGALGPSQGGLNVIVGWNRDQLRLELYIRSSDIMFFASALANTDLASSNTAGGNLNIALVAEDGANIPASAGSMSFIEIKTNTDSDVFNVRNNGMMSTVV